MALQNTRSFNGRCILHFLLYFGFAILLGLFGALFLDLWIILQIIYKLEISWTNFLRFDWCALSCEAYVLDFTSQGKIHLKSSECWGFRVKYINLRNSLVKIISSSNQQYFIIRCQDGFGKCSLSRHLW